MNRVLLICCIVLLPQVLFSQLRNGWRSVYDKEGRLNSLKYYVEGVEIPDSSVYYQYYVDNMVKGIIRGQIRGGGKCSDGSVMLFSEDGLFSSFIERRHGQAVFNIQQDVNDKFQLIWSDNFSSLSSYWKGENLSIVDENIALQGGKGLAAAVFTPTVSVDLSQNFKISVDIPIKENSLRQGIAVGWKGVDKWLLFEVINGTHYTIISNEAGNVKYLTGTREAIERTQIEHNLLTISRTADNIVFDINGNIEAIIPVPNDFDGNIALVSRARGVSLFNEIRINYPSPSIVNTEKIGRVGVGSGMIFSERGLVITTHDAVINSENLSVKGCIDGVEFSLPARILSTEESQNLAVLEIIVDDTVSSPKFSSFVLGFTDRRPASDSKLYSLGYPQAVSDLWQAPTLFEGKILPIGVYGTTRVVEMPFRYGMIGAPAFDDNLNFLGIVAGKGTSLINSEVIDFSENKRVFHSLLLKMGSTLNSPYRDLPFAEKIKKVSESVVIIESSIF